MSAGRETSKPLYPWVLVALLWFAFLLNYLDRQVIFSVFPLLQQNLKLTDLELGLLSTSFLWVYAIASPLAGYMADRFGRKKIIIASLLVWSLMTWATGKARNFRELLVVRGLMGVSEAAYLPAGLAMIADHHRERTRSSRGRLLTQAAGLALAAPFLCIVGITGSGWVLLAALTIYGVGRGSYDCSCMPVLSQIASPELRATGYGVFNFVGTFTGGISAALAGALKHSIGLGGAMVAASGVILVAALLLFQVKVTHMPPA